MRSSPITGVFLPSAEATPVKRPTPTKPGGGKAMYPSGRGSLSKKGPNFTLPVARSKTPFVIPTIAQFCGGVSSTAQAEVPGAGWAVNWTEFPEILRVTQDSEPARTSTIVEQLAPGGVPSETDTSTWWRPTGRVNVRLTLVHVADP